MPGPGCWASWKTATTDPGPDGQKPSGGGAISSGDASFPPQPRHGFLITTAEFFSRQAVVRVPPRWSSWSAGFRNFFGTRGAIFAVPDDGLLRWYRYDGNGEQDPTGSTGWAPNSGNQIG